MSLVAPENTTGTHKSVFDDINATFGVVPNMFKAIGQSRAALESMWSSFTALGGGKLDAQLGEKIAVLVADINRCDYCLAAHMVLGKNAGVCEEEMSQAQAGHSNDPRTQAALDFSAKLVKERAHITQTDVEAVRDAGFSDEEIAEILAHVALNIFTNYTNVAFYVPLDFPKVNLRELT